MPPEEEMVLQHFDALDEPAVITDGQLLISRANELFLEIAARRLGIPFDGYDLNGISARNVFGEGVLSPCSNNESEIVVFTDFNDGLVPVRKWYGTRMGDVGSGWLFEGRDATFSMMAGILESHEKRNQMAVLLLAATCVAQGTGDLQEYRKQIENAIGNIMVLDNIQKKLLSGGQFTVRSYNAAEVLKFALKLCGGSYDVSMPESVYLYTDADVLVVGLRNFIRNAEKYGRREDGTLGKITVSLTRRSTENCSVVRIDTVSTGKPLTPEQAKSIFNFGFRLPEHKELDGTGRGLFLVKNLVELSGGRVGVESGAKGNTFFMEFPSA